ncbi:hypothetical protein FHT39_000519 [Mitsuaria sp. BK045]|uniref:hypothetical protein n=1 Tax=unclassified Roseateles TaxID=2626991 RepID=UPI00161AEE65|nr:MULTISPECIES: hypothetical protein [unclassified Roseateles]MBB3291880.1 hypothetical protein [Mitsuaria sp. BK041]MBB3361097.1 hypothetical protein [Mitsuaria sp. BK045]
MKALLLRAIALASLAPLLAHAEPQVSTSGPCSPIGASSGSAEVHCTFKAPAPKAAKVVIRNAWLRPSPAFFFPPVSHSNEIGILSLVLRNLSERDVVLTAGRLEVVGAKGAVLQGSYFGEGALHSSIGSTSPIRVAAGKTAEVTLGDSIAFPGLLERIEKAIDTSKVMVIDDLKPPRSSGSEYIDQLARLMADTYGKNAYLRVSLFTEDYQLFQSFRIPLGKGVSFFYKGERINKATGRHVFEPLLAYDAFLGCYLKWKEVYVPDFAIAKTPTRCISAIPDASAPLRYRYEERECTGADLPAQEHHESRLPTGC